MKKLIPVLIATTLISTASHADTIFGVYAGTGKWKPEVSGQISNGTGTDQFNFASDASLGKDNQTGFYIAVEHPVPVVPNFMLVEQELQTQGASTFTGNFGNNTFTQGVDSEFDFSYRDYTMYYEILDNWVNLDLGLTARQFDGFVRLTDAGNPSNEFNQKLDGTLPMLYGKARVDLPLTGLSFSLIMNYVSASGNAVTETTAVIGYESAIGLGIEAGTRSFDFELDDIDNYYGDLKFDGSFVNVTYHF